MSERGPMIETPEQAAERARRQKMRSIAIALALGTLSILFYAATIVRMGGNVANRPLSVIGIAVPSGITLPIGIAP